MRYYLPGEDHKPENSVQGKTPSRKKEAAEASLGLYIDCSPNDKRKDI